MSRLLTMATLTILASQELRSELIASANAAGVAWCVAIKVIERRLTHTCRAAGKAQMQEMATWSPDQWAEEEEVRNERARQQ